METLEREGGALGWLLRTLLIGATAAAIYKELQLPPEKRTWHGRLLDFVPYDFRLPTPRRVIERVLEPGVRTALQRPALRRRLGDQPTSGGAPGSAGDRLLALASARSELVPRPPGDPHRAGRFAAGPQPAPALPAAPSRRSRREPDAAQAPADEPAGHWIGDHRPGARSDRRGAAGAPGNPAADPAVADRGAWHLRGQPAGGSLRVAAEPAAADGDRRRCRRRHLATSRPPAALPGVRDGGRRRALSAC